MTDAYESSTTVEAARAPRSRARAEESGWITGGPPSRDPRPSSTFFARRVDSSGPSASVYALGGVFTDSKGAYVFLEQVRRDLSDDDGAVIIDLDAVDQMTSCGVGILAAAFTSVQNAGRPMALAGMRPRLLAVMRAVGLISVIPNYETRKQALAATRFRKLPSTLRPPSNESRADTDASPAADGAS